MHVYVLCASDYKEFLLNEEGCFLCIADMLKEFQKHIGMRTSQSNGHSTAQSSHDMGCFFSSYFHSIEHIHFDSTVCVCIVFVFSHEPKNDPYG